MRLEATELFYIHDAGPDEGMPAWANLRVRHNRESKVLPADLAGPGLYGVFFRNGLGKEELIYIGLYAGLAADPFGGSVLDRWGKHILGFTLRARDLFFYPGRLRAILDRLNGEPADGLARALPNGRAANLTEAGPALCPPLRPRGICSTFNKAYFATENWSLLAPGNENSLLGRFTFEYRRLPATRNHGWDRPYIKRELLAPREAVLIQTLHPICNAQTVPAPRDTMPRLTPNEVAAAMEIVLAQPLEPFDAAAAIAAITAFLGGNVETSSTEAGIAAAGDGDGGIGDDEDGGVTPGEARFRANLTAAGELFISEMIENCPTGFTPFFNDKNPQLRVRLNSGNDRRLLLINANANGHFFCKTRASVEACRAIGLDAEPTPPGERVMKAQFTIHSAEHTPASLYAVLGAAVANTH